MPSDTCVPPQLPGAPEWDILRQDVAAFCRRTHAEMMVELGKHERGAPERDVITSALEFSAEVPAILERSADWRTAWSAVGEAAGSGLTVDRQKARRKLGSSQVMNYVVLALQTGHIEDFELSLKIPRSLMSSDSVLEESRKKTGAHSELRRRARGLTAAEVDQLIDEIWTREGLRTPTLPQRHILIEQTMNPSSRLDQLRTTADVLAGGKKWVSELVKVIRSDHVAEPPEDYLTVPTGDDAALVCLDADVDRHVAALRVPLGFSSRSVGTVKVQLRLGRDGTVEVWEPPSTSPQPIRLGVLEPTDAGPFSSVLAEGERTGKLVVCGATRRAMPSPRGPQRLYVNVPSPAREA